MTIILALSGGIDSMYMANRASELFPEASFAIAHCNFGLRGEEADGDTVFVQNWAKIAGIDCYVKHFDTKAYATKKGISLEMAARELRYEWFTSLADQIGAKAIAVAHNANDNAETLMLNLLRGTGSRGLRGMAGIGTGALHHRNDCGNLVVLRPLLNISRKEIYNYMISNNLSWHEDSTNLESFCSRNIIRNEIFPQFAKINPSFIKTLNEDISRFCQVDDIANDYYEHHRNELIEGEKINVAKLLTLKHWEYLLWELLENSGINSDEFASLVDCLKAGRQYAGKRFGPVLGASGRLELSERLPHPATLRSQFLAMTDGVRNDNTPSSRACEVISTNITNDDCNILIATTSLRGRGILLFDAEKLPLPLKVRKWQAGDWLIPLGMKGKKKVSDLLTDLHYSLDQKAETMVIEHPNGDKSRIAAVLFERIDDSLKVTPDTKNILKIWGK